MKKLYAIISGILIIASLVIVPSVQAAEDPSASGAIGKGISLPEVSVATPSYPIGLRSTETKLIPYRFKASGNGSGEVISQTLQFYTQYDIPLSEPMGPYPTHINVTSLETTDWNELVYLPKRVVDKALSLEEYAIVLKTTFQGRSRAGEAFQTQASLLILFPPAPFHKVTPDNKATTWSLHPFLNWGSSLGAIDYEYCFDTIDNNSCDTDWTGSYWLSTYESKAALPDLPPATTFYWQVRANNTAGTTYANNGRWWSFTTCTPGPITVANANDAGAGSLRQAITDSCPGGTINFSLSLSGQTITLASQLKIDKNLTIDGSGLNPGIEIRGGPGIRSLYISPGTSAVLKFLIIKNGQCTGSCYSMNGFGNNMGGGIYNYQGRLTVQNSTLSGNFADAGGAIFNKNGTVTILDSTVSGNSSGSAGGVFNDGPGAVLTVTNSTFSGNSASSSGGGIYNNGTLTITNSTFSGNSATSNGGGIFNASLATLHLRNTLLANSSDMNDCYNFAGDTVATNINNLIEMNSTSGHRCGTPAFTSDPKLGPLANNGGSTQTLALLMGSPAINAGNDTSCPATDQRGVTRPHGSHCDIGAYEYQKNGSDTTGVFRPSNGLLYLKNTNATGFADIAINYGLPGDKPVVGDWDGDGDATIGIYRNGSFYLRNSNTIGFADWVFPFGQPGDQPVAGDWDGDGIDTIGIYRPSTGQFLLRNSNSEGAANLSFYLGNVGDVGIAGDWDGDGKDTTGVFRPINGIIFLKNTNETGFADVALNYGIPGDKPVTGDWNNDGIDTIGVYRNGIFYLRNSNTIGFADLVFGLGNPGDMPIAGNWDGLP